MHTPCARRYWTVLIGAFALPAPRTAHVVQNQDSVWPTLVTLQFGGGAGAPGEVDASTGRVAPALDDAPYLPGFQLYLEAGDARVLVF